MLDHQSDSKNFQISSLDYSSLWHKVEYYNIINLIYRNEQEKIFAFGSKPSQKGKPATLAERVVASDISSNVNNYLK